MTVGSFESYVDNLGVLYKDIVMHEFSDHVNVADLLLPFSGIVAVAALEIPLIKVEGQYNNWTTEQIARRADQRWNRHKNFLLRISGTGTRSQAERLEYFISAKLQGYHVEPYPNSPSVLLRMIANQRCGILSRTVFVCGCHRYLSRNMSVPNISSTDDYTNLPDENFLSQFIASADSWRSSVPSLWQLHQTPPEVMDDQVEPESIPLRTPEPTRSANRGASIVEILNQANNTLDEHLRARSMDIRLGIPGDRGYEALDFYAISPGRHSDPIAPNRRTEIRNIVFESLANQAQVTVNQLGAVLLNITNSAEGSKLELLLEQLSYILPFLSRLAPYIPKEGTIVMPYDSPSSWRSYAHSISLNTRPSELSNNRAQAAALDGSYANSFSRLRQLTYQEFPIIHVLQKKLDLQQIAAILELRRTNRDQALEQLSTVINRYVVRPLRRSLIQIQIKLSAIINPSSERDIDVKSLSLVIEAALHSLLYPVFGEHYKRKMIYDYMRKIIISREESWNSSNSLTCLSIGIGIAIGYLFPPTILLLLAEIAIQLTFDIAILGIDNDRNSLNAFQIIDQQFQIAEEFDLGTESLFILFGHAIGFGLGARALRAVNDNALNSLRRTAVPSRPPVRRRRPVRERPTRPSSRRTPSRPIVRRSSRLRSPNSGVSTQIDSIETLLMEHVTDSNDIRYYASFISLLRSKPDVLRNLLSLISEGSVTRQLALHQRGSIELFLSTTGRVNALKGYVQEVLLLETDWFKASFDHIQNTVIPRFRDAGYDVGDAIFTRFVRDSESRLGGGKALTDGIIYANLRDEAGRHGIILFSIYESKSQNYNELLTQVPDDILRFISHSVEIAETRLTVAAPELDDLADGIVYSYRGTGGNTPLSFSSDFFFETAEPLHVTTEPLRIILSVANQEVAAANSLRESIPMRIERMLTDQVEIEDAIHLGAVHLEAVHMNPATNQQAESIAASLLDFVIQQREVTTP